MFAVHTCQDFDAYDPLDPTMWDFYVLPGAAIRATGQRSMNLNRVRSLAGPPQQWGALRNAILAASNASHQSGESSPTD